ncbi:MAG: M20/M25/M40 family metallo-hydrolase [bacterium]|nr:M20/M25/M40 family metallo-hydrolase [bacterium]
MEAGPRQFLLDLLATHSPSGHEVACTRVWLDYLRGFADEVSTDAYGSAFAIIGSEGTDPTVMFEGHSDEIGLMVTFVDEEGYLWVDRIGGVDPKMLPGKPVLVHAADGQVHGVLGTLAPHMQVGDLRDKSAQINDLYIDIGASGKAEALELVRVGDTVTIDHGPTPLLDNALAGRACDNKIGIWCAAEALRRYKELGGVARVVAASHVQEEVGLHGARMGAYRFHPNVSITVDVGNATDFPDADPKLRGKIKLGDGPAIRIGPAAHPRVNERLEEVAAAHGINLQRIPIPNRSGTNANAIYPSRTGVPSAILSTPSRYMHSPSETINLADLNQIPTLMAHFAAGLKPGERFTVHKGGLAD